MAKRIGISILHESQVQTSRVEVVTQSYQITDQHLRELFGIEPNQEYRVYFEVPRGGDYSGQAIDIDRENPLHVVIVTRTESSVNG